MSVITGIINGTNLNQDFHFQSAINSILDAGVKKGFKNELEITTNQCDTGVAYVEATRDNISPSQTFLVPVEVTAAETIDTSGTGYIIIRLSDAKVNDGSSNAVDGSGIATIENVSSLPSKNYLVLATLSSGVITDARTYTAIKDNTNGLLDNIQTLINTTIGAGNWKESVVAATTADITIATALNNGDTLDGVTLATGDRVLVKDQSSADENGIYIIGATPSRSTDFDSSAEVTSGVVSVEGGTINADTTWLCTSDNPVIDTDDIDFIQFTTADLKIINSKSAITTLEDVDQIMVADNSDSDNDKKITIDNFKTAIKDPPLILEFTNQGSVASYPHCRVTSNPDGSYIYVLLSGGTTPNITKTIYRYTKDALTGLYYYDGTTVSLSEASYDWSASLGGICAGDSYVWVADRQDATSDVRIVRIGADLTGATTMTISGTASNSIINAMCGDDSNLYLAINSTSTSYLQYSISGATATRGSDITISDMQGQNSNAMFFDGTDIIIHKSNSSIVSNRGLIGRFNTSGVLQDSKIVNFSLSGTTSTKAGEICGICYRDSDTLFTFLNQTINDETYSIVKGNAISRV